jgi:hypothetical protein
MSALAEESTPVSPRDAINRRTLEASSRSDLECNRSHVRYFQSVILKPAERDEGSQKRKSSRPATKISV